MNTFDITLDLEKRGLVQVVPIRQGDRNGTTIRATITDHGVAASTSGMTARFAMRLPNGTEYYRKTASLSGNTATVTIDEAQAASAVGRTDTAYFQLLQGTTVVASTESFTVVVLPDALADATVPESYDSAIQDAIDALDAAVEQMPDMVEDVLADHPEWTTTVQDGSITKAKLATDLARDRERLLYRLANMLTAQLPEGDVATASDAAQTPVAGLALYGRSTQDGTPTPSAPVPIVSVGPQLLDPTGISASSRGLTATYEGQGWFRVSGTVTGSSASLIMLWGSTTQTQYILPAGSYAFTYEAESVPTTIQLQCVTTLGSNTNKAYQLGRSGAFTMSCDGISRVCLLLGASLAAGTVVDGRFRISCYAGDTPYGWGNGLVAHGRNLLNPLLVHEGTNATIERFEGGFRVRSTQNGAYIGASTGNTNGNIVNTLMSLGLLRMGQTYTLSADVSVTAGSCFFGFRKSQNNTFVASSTVVTSGTRHLSVTYTMADDVYLSFIITGSTAEAGDVTFSNVQLEVGSTATPYQPYAETVTPIDLDGHALRSLPDGTRDELTVDERGHAVLVQRVGHVVLDGSSDEVWSQRIPNSGDYLLKGFDGAEFNAIVGNPIASGYPARCTRLARHESGVFSSMPDNAFMLGASTLSGTTDYLVVRVNAYTTLADFKAWLAESTMTLDYPLATPVTIDLGTIDPVPLVGPDLTAQAVPTAPMQLTYERDLNVTLARLESAIANLV